MIRALQLYLGPRGLCPDCGEATFVRKASLLGDVKDTPWKVDANLLWSICRGVVKAYRIPKPRDDREYTHVKPAKCLTCSQCQLRVQKLHWLEVAQCALTGPTCKECLRNAIHDVTDERGVREDLAVYVVSASKQSLITARAVLLLGTSHCTPAVSLKDEDVVLF